MIACYDLCVPHPRAPGDWLFDGASFDIPKGAWVEIVGPSGSGKSTLFDMMTLATQPARGSWLIAGRQASRACGRQLAALRAQVGSCAQRPVWMEHESVAQNLALPLWARGESGIEEAVHQSLEAWEMRKHGELPLRALTHAERQVVGVMRACIGQPALVVLDEALEGVEGLWRHRILQQLRLLVGRGQTTVVSLTKHAAAAPKGWASEILIEQGHLHTLEQPRHAPSPEHFGGLR